MATVLQSEPRSDAEYLVAINEQLRQIDQMLAEIQEGHKRGARLTAETDAITADIRRIGRRIDQKIAAMEK